MRKEQVGPEAYARVDHRADGRQAGGVRANLQYGAYVRGQTGTYSVKVSRVLIAGQFRASMIYGC